MSYPPHISHVLEVDFFRAETSITKQEVEGMLSSCPRWYGMIVWLRVRKFL